MKYLLKFKIFFFKLNTNKAFDFKEVALIVLEKNRTFLFALFS